MFYTFLLIAMVSGYTGYREVTEIGTDGYAVSKMIMEVNGVIVDNTVPIITEEATRITSPESRAEVLWVDRNHMNAIANESVISMDGAGILASWQMNSDRISFYGTTETSTPVWSYSIPANNDNMDVAAGLNVEVLSAASYYDSTYVWLSSSSVPTLVLEPARKQDITADGQYIVYLNVSKDSIMCVDTSTEVEIWKTALHAIGYQPNGIDISGDASRVLVTVYDASSGAQIYDMTDGSLVGTPVGNYSQTIGKISDDGSRIVTGDFYGRIRVYEYSGTSWNMAGSFYTGDDWVTAVAISGDGETVAGGTINLGSPDRGKVILIDWPYVDSPSVLWEYGNYGSLVSSIDICEDGSVIVAGSWGMYQGTFGDVVTAFKRSGNVIMNILDDIDEPGSIFSVSISSDGSYATASGKAVHAHQMGNGGEVYSIDLTTEGTGGAPVVPLDTYRLGEPYPNPATLQICVEVLMPQTGEIADLAVYNLNGRRIATLNGDAAPGEYVSIWDLKSDSGEPVSTGLYFLRLSAPGVYVTRKILVME